MPPTIAIFAR